MHTLDKWRLLVDLRRRSFCLPGVVICKTRECGEGEGEGEVPAPFPISVSMEAGYDPSEASAVRSLWSPYR